jgi:murein DD-endopeptidase MepM/ murein hydrolase activator NlpD
MQKVVCIMLVLMLIFSCQVLVSAGDLRGRDLTEIFLDGDLEELWESFTPELQQAFGFFAAFQIFYEQVMTLGTTWEAVYEEVFPHEGWLVYQGVRRIPEDELYMVFQWAYDDAGTIGGLQIFPLQQEAPSEFLDYETKTDLRLPFAGEWYVFWGGRSIEQNYHATDRSQRFAYDFVVVQGDTTFANTGVSNEDYYAFGLPIYAPGDGVVVAVQDGIPDNQPSFMNADQPLGNYVILDHENGEFSFLAHLKQNSVVVKPGDVVRQNDLLGLCGNSGNSSEPHLHYHLQDTAEYAQGQGLPVQFNSYLADGDFVMRGEPVQGDRVENVMSE